MPLIRRPCHPHHLASPGQRCDRLVAQGTTRCTEHEAAFQRWRNGRPSRRRLYRGDWPAHSRRRIAEMGRCLEQDATCLGGLSVDHPTDDVLCRSHHSRREAARRAARRSS